MPDRIKGRIAVVTGAASGLGKATAVALAARGARLALCDINEVGLKSFAEELRGGGAEVLTGRVDVGNREEFAAYADRVHTEWGTVGIVVNNAGVGVFAKLMETPLESWDWMMAPNLWGVVHGCLYFVPRMIEEGLDGHVVNIASAAGFSGVPMLGAYSTTKMAVVGYSEALWAELREHNIGVSLICPGFVGTNIASAGRAHGDMDNPEERERAERVLTFRPGRKPEQVGRRIVKAIDKRHFLVPIYSEAWLGFLGKRISLSAYLRLQHFMTKMQRRYI